MLWEANMVQNSAQPYGGTMAPLVVGDLVIAGVSGADEGIRGFLAAYNVATGNEAWRFWTVPAPGEAGSETWPSTLTSLEKYTPAPIIPRAATPPGAAIDARGPSVAPCCIGRTTPAVT